MIVLSNWVQDEKNTEIRAKMKKSFPWFADHGNEESPDSIVLRITLTEGIIIDNERKYGEWQYKVDFSNMKSFNNVTLMKSK